jgi:threonine/homoserine/homoserine lactone efflux protein
VEAVLAGLALGLGSGVSPGPLLALAIATTLRRGLRSGLSVAMAPLVTDTLIIVLAVTVVSQLPRTAVAVLSLLGAVVIAWFALENARAARVADVTDLRTSPDARSNEVRSNRLAHLTRSPLLQAATVNVLNPAPWLFWISAGAPILVGFTSESFSLAVGFLVAFYVAIVGSKALLVVALATGRHRLSTRGYRLILGGVAVMLAAIAIALAITGVQALIA